MHQLTLVGVKNPFVSIPVSTVALSRSAVELFQASSTQEGQRIDNFLVSRAKGVPRNHLYRMLRRGEVRVNKGRVKPSYRLRSGDLIRIPPLAVREASTPERPSRERLSRLEAAVLYEDDRLLVLNKPSGMAVHGGSGLSWGLIEAMRILRPAVPELELVHRLDRETSGCLLLSKRRSTLRELHRLLRDKAVDKRYLTLLVAHLKRGELSVDAPLRKNFLRSGERIVRVDSQAGKPACTLFRSVRRLGDFSLVEAEILTGRTHQIRVHAAHSGAPVAGDEKYGEAEANQRLKRLGLKRLFLHASALTVFPSFREQPLHVEVPLPPELQMVIEALKRKQ